MKNLFKNKKFLLALALMAMIFIAVYIFLGHFFFKQQAATTYQEKIQILANEKAAQVNEFLYYKKETLQILSSMNVFKEAVLYPGDQEKISIAKKRIEEIKQYVPGIGILTKEGIIVVAENTPAGTDYSALPQFSVNDNSTITFLRYYDIARKKDFYALGGPIYDPIEKNKVIGAISINVPLEKISALMKEVTDSGKHTEVYLIDEKGLLLSSSKYIGGANKSSVLIQEVKSDGAIECLEDLQEYSKVGDIGKDDEVEEHEEEVIKYKNYMGDDVFGAHAYAPEIMGCVIAEGNYDVQGYSLIGFIKNFFSN